MNSQLKKAWSDVREGRGRSLLMLFALVLGVWGLGSVAVSARILGPDLRENFLRTKPAHAVITLARSGEVNPAALGPTVESAEYRDLALLRVEVRPDEWIPLWLFGVGDFRHQSLALVAALPGMVAPAPGTMAIERDGLLISDLKTGSQARVRTNGTNRLVPVSGIVFDPAQAPATQDHFIYAYTDRATWMTLTGTVAERRLLVRFRDVASRGDVDRAVSALGLPADAVVTVPPFLEHPHQWQLDLLMGIIGSIGFLAFLLSAVMVGQVVGALLAKQVRQIGILKALGASSGTITMMYASYLFLLAGAAGVVSVPLAAVTGQGFAAFVARILNFDILTTAVPWETWLLLTGAALALPFGFAAPTLLRAGRITVREALASVPSVVSARGPVGGPLVLRNILRQPLRTAIVVLTTALGVAIFATGFNIRESLSQFLGSTRDAMRFDLQVVLSRSVPGPVLRAPFDGLSQVARTEVWTGGRGELQSRVAGLDNGIGVVALPFDTVMAAPRLVSGRWLTSAEAPEVVLNQESQVALGRVKVGDTVSLGIGNQARTVKVVGVAEEIDKAKVYLSQELWAQWADPDRNANTLTVVARDRSYEGVMTLKRDLERRVSESNLPVLYVISQAERTKIIADHLDIILTVLLILALLVLWVAALGTAAASSITVMERTREIGVLRAIGAGPRRIVGLFVGEGMVSAALGLGVGLMAAWPLSLVASSFFGSLMLGEGAVLRFAWNPLGGGITVVVTLLFGWLANRTPARAATKISTRRALAYE